MQSLTATHYPETTEQFLNVMERQVSRLAALWRGMKDQNAERAEQIVREYHAILKCMIELGFKQELYVDAELPERLMPNEYLDLFR